MPDSRTGKRRSRLAGADQVLGDESNRRKSEKHSASDTEGMQTRPTTDRIKETLFNILQTGMAGCYFLDLFSGSGAIGIEALSRGAAHCVFVEQDREAVRCIKDNLQKTKLQDESEILEMDVLSAIGRMDKTVRFDYVFMDPPYLNAVEERVLGDTGGFGTDHGRYRDYNRSGA